MVLIYAAIKTKGCIKCNGKKSSDQELKIIRKKDKDKDQGKIDDNINTSHDNKQPQQYQNVQENQSQQQVNSSTTPINTNHSQQNDQGNASPVHTSNTQVEQPQTESQQPKGYMQNNIQSDNK